MAEYGRHYVLRQPAETQEARRSGCAWTRRRGWPGTLSSRQARTSRSYASRVVVGHHHVAGGGFGRPARVDAVEYDGYPDAERLLSLEEETWLGR